MVDLGGSVRSSAARKRRVRERLNRARFVGGAILAYDTYETSELVDAYIAADATLHDPRSSSAEVDRADRRRDGLHDALSARLRGQSVRRGGYVLSVGGSGDLCTIAVLKPADVPAHAVFPPEVDIARRLTLGQPIDRLARNILIHHLIEAAGVDPEQVDGVFAGLEGSPPPATLTELGQLARDLVADRDRAQRADRPHADPIPAPLSPVADPRSHDTVERWDVVRRAILGQRLLEFEQMALVDVLVMSDALTMQEAMSIERDRDRVSVNPFVLPTWVIDRVKGRFGVSFGQLRKPAIEPAPGPGVRT